MAFLNPDFVEKRHIRTAGVAGSEKYLLWNGMSFEATEAYNLLRTSLLLSFADEEGARIIGVTSTGQAEGKSLTSMNLAASLAKAGYRTLLLEGDLRMPVIAKYLNVRGHEGLSELLSGIVSHTAEAIFPVEECEGLDVIFCGRIPPNPSELLGSKRMEALLQTLGKSYGYIVVDLPPIGAVPDALTLSKKLSGMLVVVRHNVTAQSELADTIRQLQYAEARILGFVYNDADSGDQGYGGHRYKKHGYSGYSYAGSKARAARKKQSGRTENASV